MDRRAAVLSAGIGAFLAAANSDTVRLAEALRKVKIAQPTRVVGDNAVKMLTRRASPNRPKDEGTPTAQRLAGMPAPVAELVRARAEAKRLRKLARVAQLASR